MAAAALPVSPPRSSPRNGLRSARGNQQLASVGAHIVSTAGDRTSPRPPTFGNRLPNPGPSRPSPTARKNAGVAAATVKITESPRAKEDEEGVRRIKELRKNLELQAREVLQIEEQSQNRRQKLNDLHLHEIEEHEDRQAEAAREIVKLKGSLASAQDEAARERSERERLAAAAESDADRLRESETVRGEAQARVVALEQLSAELERQCNDAERRAQHAVANNPPVAAERLAMEIHARKQAQASDVEATAEKIAVLDKYDRARREIQRLKQELADRDEEAQFHKEFAGAMVEQVREHLDSNSRLRAEELGKNAQLERLQFVLPRQFLQKALA